MTTAPKVQLYLLVVTGIQCLVEKRVDRVQRLCTLDETTWVCFFGGLGGHQAYSCKWKNVNFHHDIKQITFCQLYKSTLFFNINSRYSRFMLIDLSQTLNENTPVYPGDSRLKLKKLSSFENEGYENYSIDMPMHMGTHMDAPIHMVPGGKKISELTLEHFFGRGVYIDATAGFNIEEIKKEKIEEGDIVFFHTGMDKIYFQPEYYKNYPDIPEEVVNYLVEKKIKIVGMDMASPDHHPFLMHKILLKNNILIIENLTNLDRLSEKKFKVYAFPLKFELDGSSLRVVAEITNA